MIDPLDPRLEELEADNRRLRQQLKDVGALVSQSQYLFDHSPMGFVILDSTQRIAMANLAAAQLLTGTNILLAGTEVCELFSEQNRPRLSRFLHDLNSTEPTPPIRLQLPTDGENTTTLEVDATSLADGQNAFLRLVDVSDQVRAEESLRVSESHYRQVVELSPNGIGVYQDGVFVYVNPAGVKLMGAQDPAQLLGRSVLSIVHPDSRPEVIRRVEMVARGHVVPAMEEKLIRLDGSVFEAEVRALATTFRGRPAGQVLVQDVSARKRLEAERLEMERKILHTQKLEGLGVLAGGIAHDFNNILMAISANTQVALLDVGSDSPLRENLLRIESATAKATDLARQMLAYSGRGVFVKEDIDLSAVVAEMVAILKVTLPSQALLDVRLDSSLPRILADVTQIRQVVMNLVLNAAESLQGSAGTVTVVTRRLEPADLGSDGWQGAPAPAQGLVLEVTDNGCGIDEAAQARIYDPFFSTKTTGRGLGMSVVLGIVRGHSGAIRFETRLGVGTVFQVRLP